MDNENNLKSRRSDHQTLYSVGFLSKSLLSGKTDLERSGSSCAISPKIAARRMWQCVAADLEAAAAGGDIEGATIALRLVLFLERVECRLM